MLGCFELNDLLVRSESGLQVSHLNAMGLRNGFGRLLSSNSEETTHASHPP